MTAPHHPPRAECRSCLHWRRFGPDAGHCTNPESIFAAHATRPARTCTAHVFPLLRPGQLHLMLNAWRDCRAKLAGTCPGAPSGSLPTVEHLVFRYSLDEAELRTAWPDILARIAAEDWAAGKIRPVRHPHPEQGHPQGVRVEGDRPSDTEAPS